MVGSQSTVMGGGGNKFSNSSRKSSLRSLKAMVEDKITGFKEEIIVPEGNYSKKEMQKLKFDAFEKMALNLIAKRQKLK